VRDSPGGPILGIITERDILRAVAARRAPLEELRVSSCMSRDLITAQANDDITVAMRLMTTHRVRHLPVVEGETLYGIVSIGDIVKAHHDELEVENGLMLTYIQGGGSSISIVGSSG
jgi:signal-transduction protein with cAMP-binding, CBS, and nucleotidyltransferase domain